MPNRKILIRLIASLPYFFFISAFSQDMGVTGLVAPIGPLCISSSGNQYDTVVVTIKNFDSKAIDFSVNNLSISMGISGPYNQNFNLTLSSGVLAAGASEQIAVTDFAVLAPAGTFVFNAWTSLPGDLNSLNDAMSAVNVKVSSPSITSSHIAARYSNMCVGTTDTLIAEVSQSAVSKLSYSWSTAGKLSISGDSNVISTSAAHTGAMTWKVIVSDAGGCTFTDSLQVRVNNPTITGSSIIAKLSTVCVGSPDTLIAQVSQSAKSKLTYSWNPSGTQSNTGDTTVFVPSSLEIGTINLQLLVTDSGACSTSALLPIHVNPVPSVSVSGDTAVLAGIRDTLHAAGAAAFSWNTGSLNDTAIVSPQVRTTYTVTGTSSGCSARATFTVGIITETGTGAVSTFFAGDLYPNPVEGILYLKTDHPGRDWSGLRVLNVQGREVLRFMQNQQIQGKGNNFQLDVSNLEKGMYFLFFGNQSGNDALKFIKE